MKLHFFGTLLIFTSCYSVAAEELPAQCSQDLDQKVIRHIHVNVGPIFDTTNPKEDNWLFKTANALHIDTYDDVILKDLLFKENDLYSQRLVSQSERRLRGRQYLNRVQLIPHDNCDGTVDIEVQAREVWTFTPSISYSREGSNNNSSFGLEDSNFLGTGKSVSLSRSSDANRSYNRIDYTDPNTGIDNSSLYLSYSTNSDGFNHQADFFKAFESLESLWSADIKYERYEQIDSAYDAGVDVDHYLRSTRYLEAFYGRRIKLDGEKVHRILFGVTSQDNSFSAVAETLDNSVVPLPNEFVYPWVEYQYYEEDFIQARNFQQINRIEDVNLGWNLSFRAGYTSSEISEYNENLVIESKVSKNFAVKENIFLVYKFEFLGYLDEKDFHNSKLTNDVAFHWQNFESGQFFIHFKEIKAMTPLNHEYLTLGGEEGVRGYPNYYQTGDHYRQYTLEQRVYGHQEILSLFYLGGAVFFDGGHVWGDSPVAQTEQGWMRDVGFGLRLSNTRLGGRADGGHNVIHLDIAFPLGADPEVSSPQFIATVKSSF